jgi:catechol 2,3-dioxygenase-like lactoylglutathione lyase family enzyme
MSDGLSPPGFAWAPLVPELLVGDLDAGLRFWRDLCGVRVAYAHPEDGFAYLDRDDVEVMLEQAGGGRHWITAPLDRQLGRGANLQIEVATLDPILAALARAGWPLLMPSEEKWYRAGEVGSGQRQFLVQDPDGYLLRFAQPLGVRRQREA